jgi:hypothetical protein
VKRQTLVYPYRKEGPARTQPKLPGCRAWRIVPILTSDLAAYQSAVESGEVALPQLAAGAQLHGGAFPVWVRLTKPGRAYRAPLMVDNDGWNYEPTDVWSIGAVSVGNTTTFTLNEDDRFAYVVEYLDADDDLTHSGQVNAPNNPGVSEDIRRWANTTLPLGTYLFFPRPRWARNVVVTYRQSVPQEGANVSLSVAALIAVWADGQMDLLSSTPAGLYPSQHAFLSLGASPKAAGAAGLPAADVQSETCPSGGVAVVGDADTTWGVGDAPGRLTAHWSA